MKRYEAVVVGGSAGGTEALIELLRNMPGDFALPILVVRHISPDDNGGFASHLAGYTDRCVVLPRDKEPVRPGCVYTAPANYHMLVERDGTIALSVDPKVNWSRPSIDVLFESAALCWGPALVAVILSGANDDGTRGLREVRNMGGLTLAQDPACAKYPTMPAAAIDAGVVDDVLNLQELRERLTKIGRPDGAGTGSGHRI